MSDDQLLQSLRAIPEVAAALAAARRQCPWVVATAVYSPTLVALRPPNSTLTPACWLAFVDRKVHSTPRWTQIQLVMFDSDERNENAVKVMLPALGFQRVVFLAQRVPESRCMELGHLVRAKALDAADAPSLPHLLAPRMPHGRSSSLSTQLRMSRLAAGWRRSEAELMELTGLEERMTLAGFNFSSARTIDTLWLIWPTGDKVAERLSRLWLREVSRFSRHEQLSYPWVRAQVPEFRARLVTATYVYSPAQRCEHSRPSPSTIAIVACLAGHLRSAETLAHSVSSVNEFMQFRDASAASVLATWDVWGMQSPESKVKECYDMRPLHRWRCPPSIAARVAAFDMCRNGTSSAAH